MEKYISVGDAALFPIDAHMFAKYLNQYTKKGYVLIENSVVGVVSQERVNYHGIMVLDDERRK